MICICLHNSGGVRIERNPTCPCHGNNATAPTILTREEQLQALVDAGQLKSFALVERTHLGVRDTENLTLVLPSGQFLVLGIMKIGDTTSFGIEVFDGVQMFPFEPQQGEGQ